MGQIDQLTTNEKALIMVCVGFANTGLGNRLTDEERKAELKIVDFIKNISEKQMQEGVNALYKKLIADYMEG